MVDVEATKENIFDIMDNLYDQMMFSIEDVKVAQIKSNVELMRRDSSENNMKICLDDLQGIYEYLHRKYPDDDLVNSLRIRINDCRVLFDLIDESEIELDDVVQE